ncbi:Uncharacterized protein SCF082_LOCUS8429 [Durusdinium trenchii]|uniref:Methyltransferase type 11 domain-containing protein n=1 Tax=Durusdinium trenchii TaxID=1381693 RepID=A0ABP0ISE5_9DINO
MREPGHLDGKYLALWIGLVCLVCLGCFFSLERTPTWIVVSLTTIFTPVNYFVGSGYTEVDSAPTHQGVFSHEKVVEGHRYRDLRERNLGMFFAGEVWRLQRNVTVLELGCGNGQVTYNLNTVPGVKCLGLDGYKGIQSLGSNYQQWNLEEFYPLPDVDYVISFEVAEHISPKFEHNFIETLVQAKVGILLSWAYIGQGGHGHVNEHSQSYLIRHIGREGFVYCPSLSHQLAQGFGRGFFHEWEYRNLLVFFNEKAFQSVSCDLPLRDFARAEALALLLLAALLLYVLREVLCPCVKGLRFSRTGWTGGKIMAD